LSDTPQPPNPFDLFASAQEALAAQAEAAEQVVEGTAGGGVVKVQMTGGGEVTSLTLSPEVVDPTDIEMLQDLILAALRDAGTKAAELQRQAMGALGQIDLGALGGLFGSGGPAELGGPEGPTGAVGPTGPEGPGGPDAGDPSGPGR
jgi:nucleoid-associated protein EbfC